MNLTQLADGSFVAAAVPTDSSDNVETPEVDDGSGAKPAAPVRAEPDPHAPTPPKTGVRRRKAKVITRAELPADSDDEDDDEDEEELKSSKGGGIEIEVGSMPTLPSIPSPNSVRSVPAIRGSAGIGRRSALDVFLKEMGRYPLLSREDEDELTQAYYHRQDPQAAKKLVLHNLRLVVKMAYKYRRAWASVLDLIQEGNVGLVEAVRRFDPYKGAKFSTYATFWIRAYMLKFLLEHSRAVRVSRTRAGRKMFFRLNRERARLQALGIEPSSKLLAERLGVDQDKFEEVQKFMDQTEVRLDAPLSSEEQGGATILDAMASDSRSPEAQAYKNELSDDVGAALDKFGATLTNEREVRAWQMHLMAEDPMSLSELGEEFGVTKQRMGQIVNALRKRLKTHLIRELGPDVELGFNMELD